MTAAPADAFECPEPCCIATCADACTWADCPLRVRYTAAPMVFEIPPTWRGGFMAYGCSVTLEEARTLFERGEG